MVLNLRNSLFIVIFIVSSPVYAVEDLNIPSSFNPVGSGARALGMGGAFIAMADDATAASWNPSALIQLRKTEVAAVYSYTSRNEALSFENFPDTNSSQKTDDSDLNYLAISTPCSADICGKNMVFSVNYQRLYDLSRGWDLTFHGDATNDDIKFNQEGSLNALGLAYAVQLHEKVSFGFTLNFWEDAINDNEWYVLNDSTEKNLPNETPLIFDAVLSENYAFSGFNYNLGLLWDVFEKNEKKLTVGFVYKSSFDADITKTKIFATAQGNPNTPNSIHEQQIGPLNTELILTMPASYGIGFAYQMSDNLTFSADIYHTLWQDFVFINENNEHFSPISGQLISDTDIQNTTQIRLGSEYRIISQSANSNYIIPIRFGLFYDPIPSDNKNEDVYGLSMGSGITFNHWVFDIAYQYRWAEDIAKTVMPALGFSQDLSEHQIYGSLFYRF